MNKILVPWAGLVLMLLWRESIGLEILYLVRQIRKNPELLAFFMMLMMATLGAAGLLLKDKFYKARLK